MMKKLLLTAIILSLPLLPLKGEELLWLDLDLWCELEPVVTAEGSDFPVPRAEALDRLLEEARILFSYMVYGGTFTYTPSDQTRQVPETFTITPFFEIRWGDPGLEVRTSRVEGKRLHAIIRYHLAEFQARRIQSWQSNLYPSVTGLGTGNIFRGYQQKLIAFENSVKEGVREYLRHQIYNKPQQIVGDFLLQAPPYTIIKAGEYLTTSRLKLAIRETRTYQVF